MTPRESHRLLLATTVAGLVICIIGALLEATRWTTPVAVGLLMCAVAVDVRVRGRAKRERRARERAAAGTEPPPADR